MIGSNLAGSGAMLARLVALGERCGLPAGMTLIHVLDGAPLEPGRAPPPGGGRVTVGDEHHEEPLASKAAAAMRHDFRATGGLDGLKDALVAATAGEMSNLRAVRSSPAGFDAGLDEAIAEAMSHPLKRDRIAHLYAKTGLRHAAIGQIVDTSRGTVSFFLRELRAASDPRVAKGDLVRGLAAAAPDEGGEDGHDAHDLEQHRDMAVPSETETAELNPPAGGDHFVDANNMVSPPAPEAPLADGVGEDSSTEVPSQSDDSLPAGSDEGVGRAPLVPDVSPEPAAADPAAEVVGGDPGPAAPHHAERPGDEGVDSESTLTGGESAAEQAGSIPPDPACSSSSTPDRPSAPPRLTKEENAVAVERLLSLFGSTTRMQRELGAEVGLSEYNVSVHLKRARAAGDPRVIAGDEARRIERDRQTREAAKPAPSEGDELAKPPAARSPDPAPAPAHVADPAPVSVSAAPSAATKGRDQPPDDLVLLPDDKVLLIDRDWVVGPTGVKKGFPLICSTLSILARTADALLPAAHVAKKAGVRSGEAVLAQLNYWNDDLAAIGIEVMVVGDSVRLRRAA